MWCSRDSFNVLHISWVFTMMTSLFSRILIDNIGLQQEQQIVLKFIAAKGVSSVEIHHRLAAVFKDD